MKSLAISVSALFLASCGRQESVEVTSMQPVDRPASMQDIAVLKVSKDSCTVRDANGLSFTAPHEGNRLQENLLIMNSGKSCHIIDSKGVVCDWNAANEFKGCRAFNMQPVAMHFAGLRMYAR